MIAAIPNDPRKFPGNFREISRIFRKFPLTSVVPPYPPHTPITTLRSQKGRFPKKDVLSTSVMDVLKRPFWENVHYGYFQNVLSGKTSFLENVLFGKTSIPGNVYYGRFKTSIMDQYKTSFSGNIFYGRLQNVLFWKHP